MAWWDAVLLLAALASLAMTRFTRFSSTQRTRARLAAFALAVMWFSAVAFPLEWRAIALPWDNPPGLLEYGGVVYGISHGLSDPRDRPCESLTKLTRSGPYLTGDRLALVRPAGHVVGLFGGPDILYAEETDGGGWLLVSQSEDCYLSFSEIM